MTCTETRDLFSALADGALAPAERAALDAHLAGCAECRRELAGFERTVKLVRAIDPARAPAGFVDRVLAPARPEPWPKRLARRLSAPWPTLPLGAAALLLIAGLAVLLFRASPEQQQAARYQPPPPGTAAPAPSRETAPSGASRSRDAGASTTATREVAPAAPPATRVPEPPSRARELEVAKNRVEQPAPTAKSAETNVEPTAPARDAPAPAEPRAMTERQTVAPSTALEERRAKVDSTARDMATEGKRRQDALAVPSVAAAAKLQPTPQAAPLSRTGPMTGVPAAPPDVTAQLRAADVTVAERSLIELATRVGGRQTGRRIDGGRVVVELAVPREAYPQFVREATALGPLSVEQQTTERPVLAIAVTISN